MVKKTCKRLKYPLNTNDIDMLFDLVCFSNFTKGQMNIEMPVEQSREVFEKIKCLIERKALLEHLGDR